jgi:hypothetical protein
MKVKDLIAALQAQSVNPDAEVHVWLDGVHYTINAEVPVDPWGEDGMFVDINLKED